jgi:hypothetical protein
VDWCAFILIFIRICAGYAIALQKHNVL